MGKRTGNNHIDHARAHNSSEFNPGQLMREFERAAEAPLMPKMPPPNSSVERTPAPRAKNRPFILGRLVVPGQLDDVETFLKGLRRAGNLRRCEIRPNPHVVYVPQHQSLRIGVADEASLEAFLDTQKVELETALQHTTFTVTNIQTSNNNSSQQLVARGHGESSDYYHEADVVFGERNHASSAVFARPENSETGLARIVMANLRFGDQRGQGGIIPAIADMLIDRELTLEPISIIPTN